MSDQVRPALCGVLFVGAVCGCHLSPKMIGADDRWTTSSLSVLLSCRAWLYESRTNLESSAKVVPSGCATMSPHWCSSQSNPPVLFFCHRRPLIVCYLTHH